MAPIAHASGEGLAAADSPQQLRSMSVSTTPGLTATAARPGGSSWERARVRPSTAHLLAQYGATSGEVTRPQPELMLTTMPRPLSIIAGRKARMTLTVPSTLVSMTVENSSAETSHSGALLLMTPALLITRSGGG